jgi:hypothetical protein
VLVGDLGQHTLPVVGLDWGVVSGAVPVALEPRFALTPIGFFATLLRMLRFPQWQYELLATNDAVLALDGAGAAAGVGAGGLVCWALALKLSSTADTANMLRVTFIARP